MRVFVRFSLRRFTVLFAITVSAAGMPRCQPLGDNTPRPGPSLNLIKHIDPVGISINTAGAVRVC
jgi:hypothetical protein